MRVLAAVVFFVSSLVSLCQEYVFSRLTEEDGLPGNQSTCFLKDDQGFIWIGTSNGLCRYDGYDIKRFTKDMGYDISDDNINAVIQDSDGVLWVGTNGGGLNRFDPLTETFTTFKHSPEDPKSIAGDRIRELVEGDDGIIWVAFDNGLGLSKFDKYTGTSINYDPFESFANPGIRAIRGIVLDSYNPGILWLGTTSGLIRFDIEKEVFQFIDHPLRSFNSLNRYGLFALDQIDQDRLIAGFFHAGIDVYNIKEGEWDEVYTNPNEPIRIFDLARKSDTEFWVAARRNGLAIYDTDQSKLSFVPSDLSNQSTPFPGFTISVYAEDDRVWVGGKYGVSYSNDKSLLFPFDSVYNPEKEPSQIFSLSGQYNKIYVLDLTFNGIIEIDKISGQTVYHSSQENDLVFYSMMELKDMIYLFDSNRDLFIFDKKTSSFSRINTPFINGRNLPIRAIVEWNEEYALLLTAYAGTWKLDLQSNKVSPLVQSNNPQEWQQDALIDEDGSIWIGGTHGVFKFYPERNETEEIDLKIIESKEEKHIQDFAKGKDGSIWIGTTRGLIKLDGDSETLYNAQNSDLSGNVIFQIKVDREGNLWLKSQNGISKVIPSSMEVSNYDRSDGIDPEGRLVLVDGEVYYSTYGGYFKLTSPTTKEVQSLHKVHLLSFQVANKEYPLEKAVNHMQQIELDYWENSFSFAFSSPSYSNANKTQYAYRLIGYDQDWVNPQKRRYASYTNLDGGTYTFEVKAKSRGGEWGEVRSISIDIGIPFWEQWWFIVLCLITGVVVIYLISYYRLRRQIREQKILAEKLASENQLEAIKKRFVELHAGPSELAVRMGKDELNEKLHNPLTEREFEILKCTLEGKSNGEICEELSISINTVKFHLKNTFNKMGVSNRKEAFEYLLETY